MYYLGWTILVGISLWVSLIAFVWALRSGQFADSGRARYLPLADAHPPAPAVGGNKLTLEGYVLLGIGVLGLLSLLSAIVLSLLWD
jgi:cbb3-type cytochrome oxidase maturation protein